MLPQQYQYLYCTNSFLMNPIMVISKFETWKSLLFRILFLLNTYFMIQFDIRKWWVQPIGVKSFWRVAPFCIWHFDFLEIRSMNQQKTRSAVKYSISTILIDLIVYTNKQLWHIFTLLGYNASENISKRSIEIHLIWKLINFQMSYA